MKTEEHPIGFRKYILLSAFGYRLRLHVWPNGGGHDSRHNHRWWFISIPLIGRFDETRFEEMKDSEELVKIDVLDRHGERDGERAYHVQGVSGLAVKARRIRYPLVPYICRVGEIHSYVPLGEGLHASLVFVGRLQRETSEIWRDPDAIDVDVEPVNP